MKKLLTQKGFELTYFCFGKGNNHLICFPGFGRSAQEYKMLVDLLPDTRLICIDYFFMDPGSVYPPERIEQNQIKKSEYVFLINEILRIENVSRYDIMCYSMGARLAMCFAENNTSLDRMLLMAPDGVHISKWHRFSGSRRGKWLFSRLVLKRPHRFFQLIRLLRKFRILSRSSVKFLKFHLDSNQKRHLVYNTWLSSVYLIPDHKHLAKSHADFYLFIGRYDRVITRAIIPIFKSNISEDVSIHILECGHDMMHCKVLKRVSAMLKAIIISKDIQPN